VEQKRAPLQAQLDAEVQRACQAAQLDFSTPVVRYDSTWARLGIGEEGLQGLANNCVQQAVDARLAAAGPVNVDEVVKNPDAVTGQFFVMVTSITQFDAATGACSFRGYWDNSDHEYSFDFAGDNAYFNSGDSVSSCPVLTGIDQNDVARVWVQSEGSFSYDTQIGGSTTVPAFKVFRAEIIRKG
jgi:hypothetical protein